MSYLLRPPYLFGILLFFILVSYSNAIHHEFMMDDYDFFVGEKTLRNTPTFELLTKNFKKTYRPVHSLFLKAEVFLMQDKPERYHGVNIAVFFLVCVLSYSLLLRLTGDPLLSAVTTLLYTVHPINHFLLNYKTAVCLSLNIIVQQLTVIVFLNFLNTKKRAYYWLTLGLYAVNLLIHEISFIAPIYLIIISYYFKKISLKIIKARFLPFFYVLFGYLTWRVLVIPQAIQIPSVLSLGISFVEYLATIAKLIFWYLTKLILPSDILFDWDEHFVTGDVSAGYMIVFILSLAGLGLAILKLRKGLLSFGLALFLTGFLPILLASFTYSAQTHTALIEPHWFGFSSIGIFMVAAMGIISLRKVYPMVTWVVFVGFLLIALSFKTRMYNDLWVNARTYCTHWIKNNSLNSATWVYLAREYLKDKDQGLKAANYSSCQQPALLGLAFYINKQDESAWKYQALALDMDPNCAEALYGLSLLYKGWGREVESTQYLEKALMSDNGYYFIYQIIDNASVQKGDQKDGQRLFEFIKKSGNLP